MNSSFGWIGCVVLVIACSASGESSRLSLGNDGAGGSAGGGRLGAGGSFIVTGDAGLSRGLSAHIESPPGVTVKIVTVSCANDCAEVRAVATGGFEPYSFTWEDGSANPARRLCPTSTTTFSVSVTDAGNASPEFKRAPETVNAPVTAQVLDCPDSDAAVPPLGTGGAPGAEAGTPSLRSCAPIPLVNGTCTNSEGIVTPIPGALVSGVKAGLHLVGSTSYIAGQPWHYELWGSKDGCSLDERLDAFQLAPSGPVDVSWCGAPAGNFDHIVFFYRYAPTDALSLSNFTLSWCTECN